MQGVLLRDIEEADADGAEGLRFGAGALVHLAVAVFDIAQHRLAEVGEVGADLVRPPGDEADPAQRERPGGAQNVHVGDDLLPALILRLVRVDADLVVLLVVLPPGREAAALGDAHGDGVVFLFEQIGADDLVHVPQSGVALGRDDQTLGAAVQPVADAGLEAVLAVGVVLALLREVLGEGVHQIRVAGAVAVAEQVGGLVEHGDVRVLVDDRHLGLIGLLFGGFRCRLRSLRREELVVDVKFDEVAGLDAVFGGTFFAVDLDALVAEALVQQTCGKIAGHALYKAGEPHTVVVGGRSVLFHSCSVPHVEARMDRAWMR